MTDVDRLEAEIAEVCGLINAASGRLVDLIDATSVHVRERPAV